MISRDLKRMLPVWIVVAIAAVGSMAAIRLSGANYLRKGIYSHPDTCQVGEVHFYAAEAIWQELAALAISSPRTANAYSSLGVLKDNSDLAAAREKLMNALEVCPRLLGAHELLADLAWWEGDEAQTHYHLGLEHLQKSELASARIEIQTAQKQAPGDDRIQLAMLDILGRQEDWDSARGVIEGAPPAVQNSAEGLRLRAQFSRIDGDLLQAEAMLKESLAKKSGFRPAVLDLVALYFNQGNFNEGPAWLDQNLDSATAPEAADYHAIALLFAEGGNEQQALSAIEKGLAIQPNSILLLMEKALALYRLDRPQEAKMAAESALDRNPKEFIRIIGEQRFQPLAQFR